MSSKRKKQAEVVRLIVTTRERFPHTPALTRAMRQVIWRYAAEAEAARTRSAHRRPARSKHAAKSTSRRARPKRG